MRLLLALGLAAGTAAADPPTIERIDAQRGADGWRFDVTLSHPDTGWAHYADGWRVLDADGNQAGLRVLYHPHETEQPFTRSLGGVQLAEGARWVRIQAACNVDGWAEPSVVFELP